jgi:hypothetical protein
MARNTILEAFALEASGSASIRLSLASLEYGRRRGTNAGGKPQDVMPGSIRTYRLYTAVTLAMFARLLGSKRRRPNTQPKITGEIMQVAAAVASAQPEI